MLVIVTCCAAAAPDASAWGPEGHAAVGILALYRVHPSTRVRLGRLLGSTSPDRLDELCNWPDAIRSDSEWSWAAPQHYVNIPRHADVYNAERDCPDGLCVTEAVKKYAGELTNERLPQARRREAFAWLCHLVGDLHQPLHCGFADDRGGNRLDVTFGRETMNLHHFWDEALIAERAGSRDELIASVQDSDRCPSGLRSDWSPSDVDLWTGESHRLAASRVYPGSASIGPEYADRAWILIRQRISAASERLALILDATLGPGEVLLEDR